MTHRNRQECSGPKDGILGMKSKYTWAASQTRVSNSFSEEVGSKVAPPRANCGTWKTNYGTQILGCKVSQKLKPHMESMVLLMFFHPSPLLHAIPAHLRKRVHSSVTPRRPVSTLFSRTWRRAAEAKQVSQGYQAGVSLAHTKPLSAPERSIASTESAQPRRGQVQLRAICTSQTLIDFLLAQG